MRRKLNIRPLGDRVAVKIEFPKELKTDSGLLYLPIPAEDHWFDELKGEVMAVGSGTLVNGQICALELKIGDRVRVQRIGSRESWFEDGEGIKCIMLCQQADILGVICGEKGLRPLQDRLLVRLIESDSKPLSGLFIPDVAKVRPNIGIVVAIGTGRSVPGGRVITPDIDNGDKVIFGGNVGTEVKVNGETLLIMTESDVLGVIEG